jgi:hypothetical protein
MASITVVAVLTVLHPVIQNYQRGECSFTAITSSTLESFLINVDWVRTGVPQINRWVHQPNLVKDEHVITAF